MVVSAEKQKETAPRKNWELCFTLQTNLRTSGRRLLYHSERQLQRGAGGARIYRSFCNKHQIVRASKEFYFLVTHSDSATLWTVACQAPLSVGFSRPEYWSGQPFPSPEGHPNPGIEPRSPALQADSLPAGSQGKPKNTGVGSLSLLMQIFPTQESNQGLLHCRWILYQLSYEGSHPDVEEGTKNRLGFVRDMANNFSVDDSQVERGAGLVSFVYLSLRGLQGRLWLGLSTLGTKKEHKCR